MCKLKSGIILKDRIFIPDYDSHTKMLEELNIEDNVKNANNLFVRAELYPEDGNIFFDVENWCFCVDQDIIPDWFVKEYEVKRMKEEVKKWYKEHIFINVDDLELSNGNFYLKDCKNAHFNNSTSKHYGNSTSEHYDNSTSEHYDNSTSKHYGNSTSEHYDNSTSEHYGNSTSKHYGNSTSEHCDNSTSEHYGNSTSEHCDNSTSEHYGNSTSKHCDNSTSKHYDNSTSEHYDNSTSKQKGESVAIIPMYSNNTKDNIVLLENSTLKDCKNKIIYQSGDYKLVVV